MSVTSRMMQCNEEESDSLSDSDTSSQYQDAPLRLVTRQELRDEEDSAASMESPAPSAAQAPAFLRFPSLCSQLARSSQPASHSPLRQGSQVDQDTNNLFGGEHGSVIRKGIANGQSLALTRRSPPDPILLFLCYQASKPATVIIRRWSSQA